jgi:cobalamin biosynthesis Mg chelatase CobN
MDLLKKILVIAFVLSFNSCDVLKSARKQKNDIQSTEKIEVKTTRKGDTIRFEVPKITYKDTTIVKTNYVTRTQARVNYNAQGGISSIECISAEINELRREIRTINDQSKTKEQEKEKTTNTSAMVLSIIAIGIALAIILVAGIWIISRQIKS